jgi:glycosyltransferase involved in cell wall biosynthesis
VNESRSDDDGAELPTPRPGAVSSVIVVAEQLRRAVPGGIGTFAEGLLGALGPPSAGISAGLPAVSLLASRPPTIPDPLDVYGFPVHASFLPGRALTRAWSAGIVGAPASAALVHSVSLAAPRSGRVPLVVTVHDLAWRTIPEAFPRRGRRWHESAFQRALVRAARLAVPSRPVADRVVDAGADIASVRIVGVGSDHLPPPDHDAAARVLARIGVHGPFLLSVGTLEPRKNLDALTRAYTSARSSLPGDWPLVLVGPTGWGSEIDRIPGVAAAGRVAAPILSALYERAALLVYVPIEEGFGLPPVEAMRAGTAVVASAVPSVGDAALVVDPANADDIAAGLVALSTDEDRRRRLVEAGKRHVADMTWRAVARRHVAMWREVLDQGPAAGPPGEVEAGPPGEAVS